MKLDSHAAYDELLGHLKSIAALEQAAGVLDWDREVMMPRKGGAQRAEQSAALEGATHQMRTDPRFPVWFASIEAETLDPVAQTNLAEAKKDYTRATKIPAKLAEELARVTSRSQTVWADARAANRFQDFAPVLAEVLDLRRQEAACLAEDGSLYDALLNDYEPGAKSADLTAIFDRLRPGLSDLRARIAETGRTAPAPSGQHAAATQMAVARKLADVLGYDWDAGRLDLSVHPFSSGSNGDSRITTRVDEGDIFNCIYSTIHETGHAVYEQNMPAELALMPAGKYASMGVHESQSRLMENQIGRSRAFAEWMYPVLRAELGDFGLDSPEALYRAANSVRTGFIRTEADEVHYNLHVILRFNLEQALIAGDLQVADLEGAWNDAFLRDFGLVVPKASQGVLQDVHWSLGLFGYFPTYALGNVYAAELDGALRAELPDLDTQVAAGDTGNLVKWLGRNVHSKARTMPADQIISAAAGHTPTEKPLLAYLERKFSALYDL